MAYTDPTSVNVSAGMNSIVPYISEVTNFWFGRMLMLTIFSIFAFGYLKVNKDDYVGAFAVSSYISFVIGLFLWVAGLVSGYDFSVIIGVSIVSSVALFMQKKEY